MLRYFKGDKSLSRLGAARRMCSTSSKGLVSQAGFSFHECSRKLTINLLSNRQRTAVVTALKRETAEFRIFVRFIRTFIARVSMEIIVALSHC
jgi:hypothetical protein